MQVGWIGDDEMQMERDGGDLDGQTALPAS